MLVEEVTSVEGNLTRHVDFFFVDNAPGGKEPFGGRRSVRLLAHELVRLAPWMGGVERVLARQRHEAWLVVPALAFGAATVLAYRRDDDETLRGLVIAAAAVVVAGITVAGIVGTPFAYLVRWSWGIALFFDVMVLWALLPRLTVRPRVRQVATWTVVAVLFGLGVSTIVRDRGAELPGGRHTPAWRPWSCPSSDGSRRPAPARCS